MSLASFFTGIEAYAAKGEAELTTLLADVKALDAAFTASNTASPSLVITNVIVGLKAAEAFLQLALTETAPFVTALQQASAALAAPPATDGNH